MRIAIKVTDINELVELDLDAPEGSYKVLSDAVEGMIEPVDLEGDITMWVNEEFLFIFPTPRPNSFATALFARGYDIQGNVIFTGGVDEEGETLGLSDQQAIALRRMHLSRSVQGLDG